LVIHIRWLYISVGYTYPLVIHIRWLYIASLPGGDQVLTERQSPAPSSRSARNSPRHGRRHGHVGGKSAAAAVLFADEEDEGEDGDGRRRTDVRRWQSSAQSPPQRREAVAGRLVALATLEVQRQRSEQQQRREAVAATAAASGERERRERQHAIELELREEVKLLTSEIESWRRRAETSERSARGMSHTMADISAGQEASTRAAEVARAAQWEAERRLEDIHRQYGGGSGQGGRIIRQGEDFWGSGFSV